MSEDTAVYVTERLLMRPLTREQAERIVAEDRIGQAWSAGYPRPDDQDVARMFLAQDSCHDPRFGPLQIVLRDTGLVVGGIGFLGPPGVEGTVGAGYGLAPEVEGRGFATEALCGLLDFGFATGLVRRVIADTAHDNIGSQRVMDKAGMRRTGSDDRLHYYEAVPPL